MTKREGRKKKKKKISRFPCLSLRRKSNLNFFMRQISCNIWFLFIINKLISASIYPLIIELEIFNVIMLMWYTSRSKYSWEISIHNIWKVQLIFFTWNVGRPAKNFLWYTHNLMVSSSGFVAFSSDFLCTFMYVVMHGVLYQLLNALFKIIMKIDRIKSVWSICMCFGEKNNV